MDKKTAIIIGAGPAGLTAAYELLTKTDITPLVFEATSDIGGISKTVNYKGNRIDIGGHRFFSKSEVVMDWWKNFFPYEDRTLPERDPDKVDLLMLIRNRLSRIMFLHTLFDYPVTLSYKTLKNLGIFRIIHIGSSYIKTMFFKRKPETSLEDFFINRFGVALYKTFFKSYTEKVWGVPCSKISPEWGGQRIKGLSILKTVLYAVKNILIPKKASDISQKNVETTLISKFLYPKYGPGQFWEHIAQQVRAKGGTVQCGRTVKNFEVRDNKVLSCTIVETATGKEERVAGDYFFSSMPIKDLINGIQPDPPQKIKDIANGLVYRDFITVGVLLKNVKFKENNENLKDNWIYIQEKDVSVGRLQIFNNWSPYMVKDPNTTWIGMEYFCFEGDELWSMDDDAFKKFAVGELIKIGFTDATDVLDATMVRMPKTYPCYFGTYNEFGEIKKYVNGIPNLFLIGRNGMHKYNNADHSMLTAIKAVENIVQGITDKENIWQVNTEEEYHEEKKPS